MKTSMAGLAEARPTPHHTQNKHLLIPTIDLLNSFTINIHTFDTHISLSAKSAARHSKFKNNSCLQIPADQMKQLLLVLSVELHH